MTGLVADGIEPMPGNRATAAASRLICKSDPPISRNYRESEEIIKLRPFRHARPTLACLTNKVVWDSEVSPRPI